MSPPDRATMATADRSGSGSASLLPFLQGALSATATQHTQAIYAAIPIILFEIDDDGRILNLNPTFEKITGWSPQSWIGHSFIDLVAPEDRTEALSTYRRVLEQGEQTFMRLRLIAANGETLTLEVWTHRLVDDSGEGPHNLRIFGYAQDISQSVAATQRLQLQQEMFDNVSDAIIVTDPAFYVVEWNRAAEVIYGWQRSEVIGRSLVGLLGTKYADTTQEAVLEEFLRTGRWRGEVIQYHKNGETLHILASVNALYGADGRRSGVVAINRDVTAEVNARQALARVEHIYREAIRGIGGVPYLRDYSTPGYSFIGDEIEELTGYRADELTGPIFTSRLRKIDDYSEHADLSHEDRVALARQSSGIVWSEDYLFERKDGSLIWLADHAVPVLDEQGNVTGSLGILMDITPRKRAEEERQRMQERIAQIERLETVGQLAGGVAHDFNNMLAVILMRTEMALQQVDALSPLHRHLTEIYKTAQRSAELTRQLLGFARRQPIAPRVLDLNQTVEELTPMVRHLVGEEITLQWQPADAPAHVYLDPAQVSQILVNLCVNARDAMNGPGTITVSIHNVELDEAYAAAHGDVHPGAFCALTVSDTGCGMTPDILEHIFEPFFTTKEVGRGTGLGLATVYGIVQQNRGHILVDSTPNVGTSFQILLPRYDGESAPTAPEQSELNPGSGKTILVVEDNVALLEMMAEGLRKQGYRVISATSASEAQRRANHYPGTIHLLLTDVVMPELDGATLARLLQNNNPEMRVLYTSGYPAQHLERRGLLAANPRLLHKPFTLAALAEAVNAVLTSSKEEDGFAPAI